MPPTKKYRNKTATQRSPGADIIITSLKAMLIGALCALIFALAACALLIKSDDPMASLDIAAYLSVYIAALVCGLSASKLSASQSLIPALLSGALLLAFQVMTHIFCGGCERPMIAQLAMFASIPLTALVGGFLGKIKIVRRRKRRFS